MARREEGLVVLYLDWSRKEHAPAVVLIALLTHEVDVHGAAVESQWYSSLLVLDKAHHGRWTMVIAPDQSEFMERGAASSRSDLGPM